MNSDKSSFVSRMEGKGFVTDMEQGVSVMMTGNYMGEEVTLLVGFTPKTQQVYCITVMFLPMTVHTFSSLEEKLNAEKFMRCHKSYIISIDAIKKLEVYGRWTYIVRFKGTDETALMTSAKYDEIKKRY